VRQNGSGKTFSPLKTRKTPFPQLKSRPPPIATFSMEHTFWAWQMAALIYFAITAN